MRVLIVACCLALTGCNTPPNPNARPLVLHPAQFPQQPIFGGYGGGISPPVLVNTPGGQMNCTRIGNIVNCN